MVKAEDIVFWILILTVIAVAIWLAFGSPDFEGSLLMIIIFVAGSEILLWRALFSVDKRASVGFEKVNSDIGEIKNNVSWIKDKLMSIESSTKKIEARLLRKK